MLFLVNAVAVKERLLTIIVMRVMVAVSSGVIKLLKSIFLQEQIPVLECVWPVKVNPELMGGLKEIFTYIFLLRMIPSLNVMAYDLYRRVDISFATAALGSVIKVNTLEGQVELKIPAGTQMVLNSVFVEKVYRIFKVAEKVIYM